MELLKLADDKKNNDKNKKKESKQEKRNKALREKYAQEMKNFERTSNTILEKVRTTGTSVHAPDVKETVKQRPEQISDIHIVISQQYPKYAREGKDDSDEQEKKMTQKKDDNTKDDSTKNDDTETKKSS